MSYRRRRNRNKMNLRPVGDVPLLVERVQQVDSATDGRSYEEANWARLSPAFRAAHNRLRQAKGLPTIPPPRIDLYVAPQRPRIDRFDPTNREFVASAREFLGTPLMGPRRPDDEGFWINGERVRF